MSASLEASGGPPLRREDAGAVCTLTLDRPGKHNALDLALVQALHAALGELEAACAVGAGPAVVILTGAGERAFAAGADIAELRQRRAADALAAVNSALFDRLARLPLPTIAAVRGYALGGGCELAIACDLRVAGRSARFGQPEVGLGVMAAAGATYRLPALIGLGRARELLLTGRLIDAEEAHRIGLCERVVDDADDPSAVLAAAQALAAEIAANDPLALRLTKAALGRVAPGGPAWIAAESTAQAVLFEAPGKAARMDRFLADRAARAAAQGAPR
jgi:enoyl-CoA hydratase